MSISHEVKDFIRRMARGQMTFEEEKLFWAEERQHMSESKDRILSAVHVRHDPGCDAIETPGAFCKCAQGLTERVLASR